MAFAALGAAEVLAVLPDHREARALMTAVAIAVGRPAADEAWRWPEPRLSYANAALPEALLAAAGARTVSPHSSRTASACWVGYSTSSHATGTCPWCRPQAGSRATGSRLSTSSRSR